MTQSVIQPVQISSVWFGLDLQFFGQIRTEIGLVWIGLIGFRLKNVFLEKAQKKAHTQTEQEASNIPKMEHDQMRDQLAYNCISQSDKGTLDTKEKKKSKSQNLRNQRDQRRRHHEIKSESLPLDANNG